MGARHDNQIRLSPRRLALAALAAGILLLVLWLPTPTPAAQVRHNIIAGNLRVTEYPGFNYATGDDNTNAIVTCTLSINGFTNAPGPFGRADYTVWANPSTLGTSDYANGLFIGSVMQNGRTNFNPTYGTNCWQICQTAANTGGSSRLATCQTVGSLGTGIVIECNANVAGAFFPYSNWLAGWALSLPYTNGYPNNYLVGSPGLKNWSDGAAYTNVTDLLGVTGASGGQFIVDLRNFGVWNTNGVLLVAGGKDENNFAQSSANSDGTWNVFVHDIGKDSTGNEQDEWLFVYVPRTNATVVSGTFQVRTDGSPYIGMYSGPGVGVTNYPSATGGGASVCPVFTITNLGTGRWALRLKDPNYSPTNGVLITSPAGGGTLNVDNIVTYQGLSDNSGWEIQSHDLPSGNLQNIGNSSIPEDCCSFVFIPGSMPMPSVTVTTTNTLHTTSAGGKAAFTVVLESVPTNTVTIPVNSSDTNQGTADRASLTFTTGNWSTPQAVTVTGQPNTNTAPRVAYQINLGPTTSADSRFNGLVVSSVAALNFKGSLPGLILTKTSVTTSQIGQADTFGISLTTQPTANVVIGVSSSDLSEATVAPAGVTFTTNNYATPQIVTVTGVNDFIVQGDVAYTILTAPAVSSDAAYNGVDGPDVSGINVGGFTQASITKANNSTALNLSGSWVSNGPPGGGDTAVVDSTLTSSVTANLGASMAWYGIQIVNPGGTLTLGATGGATLTLSTGGIDMTAAAGQSLNVNCPVAFGNTNTWDVAASSTLTVSGNISNSEKPLIVQGGGDTVISGAISGGGGFTKQGTGTLLIDSSGINDFTGKTTIAGGMVSISDDSGLGAAPTSAVTNQLTLNGGTLQTTANMTLSSQRGITVGAAGGSVQTLGALAVQGLLSGAGSLTINGGGELGLSTANPFTGSVRISDGTMVSASGGSSFGGVFGKAGTITITNASLYAESGNNGPFGNTGILVAGNVIVQAGGFLEIGNSVTAHIPRVLVLNGGELSSSGLVNATYGSWNLDQGVTVNGGNNTSVISAEGVTVSQTGGTVFNVGSGAASGIDLDVTGYIGSFPSASDNGLIKAGAGVMRLSGDNTYTNATTISNGVLRVDGWLGAGALTVKSGGTLAGIGTIAGTVSVQKGGFLAPGDGDIGWLTVNNSLTLAGTTVVELNKSGATLAADQVVGVSTLSYGGSLVVTNSSDRQALPLAAGDTFPLFSATSYTGAFTNLTLPILPGGLGWDTTNLSVNGSITVVANGSAPLLTSQPQSLTVNLGSAALFRAVAAGPRPLAYQWQKNGTNIASATTTTYAVASVSTNSVAGYRVVVTNAYGSVTSAVAALALNPSPPATPLTNGLVVYLSFDNNLNGQLGTTVNGVLYTGGATNGPRYKPGVIGSAVGFANTGGSGQPSDWAVSLGSLEPVYSNSFSVAFWERSPSGAGALMGNKNWSAGTNPGWVIAMTDAKNVNWNAVGGTSRNVDLNPPFSDGYWHLVVVSFNRATNGVISYLDGVVAGVSNISPSASASLNAGTNTLVGGSGNGTYAGAADIDDLAVWNRVVTPDEVAAIYAAGLIGKPLNYAVPNQAPVILTNLPATVSVASGGSVTLSVTAGGPGPFSYQWRFNGVAIVGATNAALALAGTGSDGIDASSEGVYTVLVGNGYGGVVSSKAVLTVYSRVVTGQWDFWSAECGLRATVGADLEYVGDTTNNTAFPVRSINGVGVPVMAFGSNAPSRGFTVWHGAMPNGGGQFVNQYTLIMDVMFPAASSGQWRALFQSDPFNHPGNDAEFYVGSASASPSPNGLGAEGQYDGSLAPDTWYRVAYAVDLTAGAGQQLGKYVNGVLVGSQSLSGGVDGRYALGPAAQLLTSGLGGGSTQPGYVSSVQFVNGCLPAGAIAALGGPNPDKLPPGEAVIQITNLSLTASQLTLNWGGPSGRFQVQNAATLSPPVWQSAGTLSSNHSLTLPASGAMGFYRVSQTKPDIQIGQLPYGEQCLSSKEIIRAPGSQVQFYGLPVDLVLSPDGTLVYIKNYTNMWVVDAATWTLQQTLDYPASGASLHGIAVSPNGTHVYVTGCGNELYDWTVAQGSVTYSRTISLATGSDPCGLAISADGTKAYVCLSIANKLAVVNLTSGTVSQQITVGIAPWDVVLSPDGSTAYVSDWGGRFSKAGDLTETSAGTAVVIDARGVAASGVVSVVNLATGLETTQVATGLHPSDLVLSKDGSTLYVANANSDTVTVINPQTKAVRETILVRPSATLPFGSSSTLPFGTEPGGLALSVDGTNLFVAAAGNNAIAVIELPNAQHTNSVVQGFFPTDWYPGAVAADSNYVYVPNVKGLGTRWGQPTAVSFSATGSYLGTANRIPIPSAEALSKYSAQVNKNGRISQMLETQQGPRAGQTPVPVPVHVGEPSVFQHVLYIIKENKTYDQMFGDMAQGNGNANLCIYPQWNTPNHHALAQQYVLLDNFYCNGVNSAVGHSWCTEANDSDHLEKSFGGFVRSYGISSDPLTFVSSGFIWNNVLQHGLSFRNYNELNDASSSASWLDFYTDYTNGTHAVTWVNTTGIASLKPYTSTNVPGWNLDIPDQVRAYGFIKDLNAAQARGTWEALHCLWLPDDHTGGTPPAKAELADNDLALGQIVEAVTKSIFGSNTVIFVIEDDPQSGYDHVDGHRSICLVISPYTKRNQVVSTFYNQAGVLHTMEQIMGIPPMNQGDAMAPLMFDCFTNTPNFTPFTALPNNVDLVTGGTAMLSPKARYYAKKVQKMDFSKADRINDDVFNRYIWHSIKGDARYPSEFVGGHGKGLKKLGLVLAKAKKDDDD